MTPAKRCPRKARESKLKWGQGWAWAFEGHISNWVDCSHQALDFGGPPSPEAIKVAVYIVPRSVLPRRKPKKGRKR